MPNEPTKADRADFRGFCRNATNNQLQGIYEKESAAGRDVYAEIAEAEAARRGLTVEKRPAREDREGGGAGGRPGEGEYTEGYGDPGAGIYDAGGL